MLTLHGSIAKVLSEVDPRGLPVSEIGRIIRERRLYMQRDGGPVSAQQIHARIRNYKNLFEINKSTNPQIITLRKEGIRRKPISTGRFRQRQSVPHRGGRDWFWEGNVQAQIRDHLASEGWEIRQAADTDARSQGVDLLAVRAKQIRAVEVKGYPSTKYARGERQGQEKPTQPTTQARHWYAQALLSALLLQTAMPEVEVFMGFPDMLRYRRLVEKTEAGLKKLNIGVYLVREDGQVQLYVAPS